MKSFKIINMINFIMIAMAFCSCSEHKEIELTKYNSNVARISVQAPLGYSINQQLPGWLVLTKGTGSSFSIIEIDLRHKTKQDFEKIVRSAPSKRTSKFNHSLVLNEDSLAHYHITAGMFSTDDVYILCKTNEDSYICNISGISDLELCKRIANSVTFSNTNKQIKNDKSTKPTTDNNQKLKKWQQGGISLLYPSEWKILELHDEMNTLYFGTENQMTGFTFIHFPANCTYKEMIEEIDGNIINSGFLNLDKSVDSKIGTYNTHIQYVSGVVSGKQCKQRVYTILYKGHIYSFRFGNDPNWVATNSDTMNRIIKSLEIK